MGWKNLKQVISLKEIASMIERTAKWVSPEHSACFLSGFPSTREEAYSIRETGLKSKQYE